MLGRSMVKRNGKIVWKHGPRNLFGTLKITEWTKTPGINIKNMASSEGDQALTGAFHAIMEKTEDDMLQIVKKWNWKWIFIHQGYFFTKVPTINSNFAPKHVHLQGSSLRLGQNCKDVPTKILKRNVNKTQFSKRKKDLLLNSRDRLAKERWIHVKSNSKAFKFQQKRCHFRLWVFAFNSQCFYC